jgi:hypothetical protein
MSPLAPFVERRSRARLGDTPLRRRAQFRPATLLKDRRSTYYDGFDVAGALELQLDRYPTSAAMLSYVQSLMYATDDEPGSAWRTGYLLALQRASEVLQTAGTAVEAVATLQGYQAWMARHWNGDATSRGALPIASAP